MFVFERTFGRLNLHPNIYLTNDSSNLRTFFQALAHTYITSRLPLFPYTFKFAHVKHGCRVINAHAPRQTLTPRNSHSPKLTFGTIKTF